ncbi:MAG: hypothetical protein MZV64_71565 [Ignavibacteriales bacterium]|nr:hypothetical protein [Ignavibacteriales bacterium]
MSKPSCLKAPTLKANGTFHHHAQRVRDTLFQEQAFFDPRPASGQVRNVAPRPGRGAGRWCKRRRCLGFRGCQFTTPNGPSSNMA